MPEPAMPEPAVREPAWRREGTDPDYRFSLANERSFLAWIRTALAVLASAIALDQFASRLGPPALVLALATALSALAALLCAAAHARWRANEIAMRHARRLPASRALAGLALALGGAGAAVALMLLLR